MYVCLAICMYMYAWQFTAAHARRGCTHRPMSPDPPPAAVRRAIFCNMSRRPKLVPCIGVHQACFFAEGLLLHGAKADRSHAALRKMLARAKDVMMPTRLLHATNRSLVQVADPGKPFDYLPLAISARAHQHVCRLRTVARQPVASAVAPTGPSALAFFTSWSNYWQETFGRAVVQVFEHWCAAPRLWGAGAAAAFAVIPAAWGSSEPRAADESQRWLAPFSAGRVWPMSLMPSPTSHQQNVWRGDARAAAAHAAASAAYFAARDGAAAQRCYDRTAVCDFGTVPHGSGFVTSGRPWSTMQAVTAWHAGMPPPRHLTPHLAADASGELLRVLFVQRRGRRELANAVELLEACGRWRPAAVAAGAAPRRLEGSLRSLAAGPDDAEARRRSGRTRTSQLSRRSPARCSSSGQTVALLRSADVLVSVFGADLVNGLALHAGATILEVLPVSRGGCQCDMYQKLFAREPSKLFHYAAASTDRRHASGSRGRGYDENVALPAPVLFAVLGEVVRVDAQPSRYAYRVFEY